MNTNLFLISLYMISFFFNIAFPKKDFKYKIKSLIHYYIPKRRRRERRRKPYRYKFHALFYTMPRVCPRRIEGFRKQMQII